MNYAIEYVAKSLKNARKSKGLNQRDLSKLTGVPQSHISKIENGAVDLRLSSLVELARVLDLEFTLVPRKSKTAVSAIVRSAELAASDQMRVANNRMRQLQKSISESMQGHLAIKEVAQLQRQIKDLSTFKIDIPGIETLHNIDKAMSVFKDNTKGLDAIQNYTLQIQELRNKLVHSIPQTESIRPAYRLEDDSHG